MRHGCIRTLQNRLHDKQVTVMESQLEGRLSGHINFLLASNSNEFMNFHRELSNIPDKQVST